MAFLTWPRAVEKDIRWEAYAVTDFHNWPLLLAIRKYWNSRRKVSTIFLNDLFHTGLLGRSVILILLQIDFFFSALCVSVPT